LFIGEVVASVIHLPYLRLMGAWYRWRIARVDRQLRRHGIDPEAIPEIQELRRRRRQLREERERSAATISATMTFTPWKLFLIAIAGWINRQQQEVIPWHYPEHRPSQRIPVNLDAIALPLQGVHLDRSSHSLMIGRVLRRSRPVKLARKEKAHEANAHSALGALVSAGGGTGV
jgi:hypothetical protein